MVATDTCQRTAETERSVEALQSPQYPWNNVLKGKIHGKMILKSGLIKLERKMAGRMLLWHMNLQWRGVCLVERDGTMSTSEAQAHQHDLYYHLRSCWCLWPCCCWGPCFCLWSCNSCGLCWCPWCHVTTKELGDDHSLCCCWKPCWCPWIMMSQKAI